MNHTQSSHPQSRCWGFLHDVEDHWPAHMALSIVSTRLVCILEGGSYSDWAGFDQSKASNSPVTAWFLLQRWHGFNTHWSIDTHHLWCSRLQKSSKQSPISPSSISEGPHEYLLMPHGLVTASSSGLAPPDPKVDPSKNLRDAAFYPNVRLNT